MATLPPPPDTAFISVYALEAALAKLGVTSVTATQLLQAVREEENNLYSRPKQTGAVLPLKTPPNWSIPPYESTLTWRPISDSEKARRLILRDLTRKDFPDSKIPDPYATTWLNLSGDSNTAKLPFIQATITVSPQDWPYDTPLPEQTFQNVWALWDTGAQVSQILSSRLDDAIKRDENGDVQPSGYVTAKVMFTGIQQEFECVIRFQPTMPNDTTFIVLGQHYGIQPTFTNPSLQDSNAQAYGLLELICYCDRTNPDAPLVLF